MKLRIEHLLDIFNLTTNQDEASFFDEEFVDVGKPKPFGQRLPRSRIFNRTCYMDLFNLICSSQEKVIILMGSPGIGKSPFVILFLLEVTRLYHCGQLPNTFKHILHIVYEHPLLIWTGYTDFCLIDLEQKSIESIQLDKAQKFCTAPTTFFLKDGSCLKFFIECPCLWITSPSSHAAEMLGREGVGALFVPPFETEELIKCYESGSAPEDLFSLSGSDGPAFRAMTEVMEQYDEKDDFDTVQAPAIIARWAADLGPFAHRVFRPRRAYYALKRALNQLSSETFADILRFAKSGESGKNFNFSHSLLTMRTTDFRQYTLAPATTRILSQIYVSLMGRLGGVRLGTVYEPYCHEVFCNVEGFQIEAMRLDGETAGSKKVFDFGKVIRKDVTNADLATHPLSAEDYCVPTDSQFPAVDAWTTQGMLQMTAAADGKHPIKSAAKLFKKLEARKDIPSVIIFIVPRHLFATFKAVGTQAYMCTDGRVPAHGGPPHGGWNNLEQYLAVLGSIRGEKE